jgi:hypothetical protein
MKKIIFISMLAVSVFLSPSCKKDKEESKVKTFVENMSFVIDYADEDGTGRIYGYRYNYSEDFKAALKEMNDKGGTLTFYISNSDANESTRTYYELPVKTSKTLFDKGSFKTNVTFEYGSLAFTNGNAFVSIDAKIPEKNNVEIATVIGKFVITLP